MDSGLTTGSAYPVYSSTLTSVSATITDERAGDKEAVRVRISQAVADNDNIVVHYPVSEVAENDVNGITVGMAAIAQVSIFYTLNTDARYRQVHYAKTGMVS